MDALRCSLARRFSRHERSCRRGIPCAPHRVGFYSVPQAGTFGPASTLLLALDRRVDATRAPWLLPLICTGPSTMVRPEASSGCRHSCHHRGQLCRQRWAKRHRLGPLEHHRR